MKLTTRPFLPPIPKMRDRAAEEYCRQLQIALRKILLDIYEDTKNGASELKAFSAAPAATEAEANRLVLRTDAGNEAIYVNVDGTMKSVALT